MPVIAVAAATPATAASTVPDVIITDSLLILEDFTATYVVCGGVNYLSASCTITTPDGTPFVEETAMTITFYDDDQNELSSYPSSDGTFNGVPVAHKEIDTQVSGLSGTKVGIFFTTPKYPTLEDSEPGGGSSGGPDPSEMVTKTWIQNIAVPETETYTIENFTDTRSYYGPVGEWEYYWHKFDFDVSTERCGLGLLAGTSAYLTYGGNGHPAQLDSQSHVTWAPPNPYPIDEPLTIEIGDWSTTITV
ncbi:hypothetical protein [Paramicrobacterium chengjingii]|uniref:hypothetical protein n=1 Tax=Paramicrobacterium chengjingii TaxID=2769067 RepID=UPI00141DADD2|nr:hypothetical protein [Microbacterium chengjingii]